MLHFHHLFAAKNMISSAMKLSTAAINIALSYAIVSHFHTGVNFTNIFGAKAEQLLQIFYGNSIGENCAKMWCWV